MLLGCILLIRIIEDRNSKTETYSDPADPREVAEGAEKIARKDVPHCRTSEGNVEESFTTETAPATNTGVLGRVKGVEERARNEIRRPDHRWRLDEETPRNTSDRKPDQLGGHDNKPLKAKVVSLIVVYALHGNYTIDEQI